MSDSGGRLPAATEDTSAALPSAPRGEDAVAVRHAAAQQRADATRSIQDLKRRRDQAAADIERRRRALDAELAKQRAELDALMKPLQEQLAQLTEVAWTVDLYLGRDESLQLIRDGAPAPADTPLTIRQKVLVMAEESLVLLGRKATGMDAEDIDAFVDWLLASPQNLDRILPEPKGVVVLVPTRVDSRSGNPWEDAAKNDLNAQAWWLLRNGEKLYLLTTDPDLRVADRVLPRRTEFTRVFDQRDFGADGTFGRVEPGSERWLQLEKVADRRRRHFMRIMLVLQGLIDRTPVWAPLPQAGINLLDVREQDRGAVVLIQDAETSIQLGDGREPFADWQKRLNGLLRPGLRVIGDWNTAAFWQLCSDGRYGRGSHPRLYPPTAECLPQAGVPHLIEDRRDDGLVIRYQRTDQVWRRNVPVPDKPGYVYRREHPVTPTQRASCIIHTSDTWVLPLDLVTEADLRYYLNSREERSEHFLSMVPTLRSALAAKETEATKEAPFRSLLTDMLTAAGADPDTAPATLDELITWWKSANTWVRPLNGAPDQEAKAAREIITEYRRRADTTDTDQTRRIIAAGRAVPGAIAVARTRSGTWAAYTPSTPAHDQGVFLDVTTIRKDGTLGAVKTWQRVQPRTATALHVPWHTDAWATWKFSANPRHYLTAPERTRLLDDIRAAATGTPVCITELFDPATPSERHLILYWATDTPEDAPLLATSSPLGWRSEHGADPLIESTAYRVVKDASGVTLTSPISNHHTSSFDHYSGGSRWGDTPWWPEDAHRYGDVRPRLAWADEDMLDRIKAYTDRCAAAAEAEQQARRDHEQQAYRYSTPTYELICAHREADLKARFLQDYGTDAEDLWPAHWNSLPQGTRLPIHPRTVWSLVSCALKHGHDVAGMTLNELADIAATHKHVLPGDYYYRSRFDPAEFATITIPAPDPKD